MPDKKPTDAEIIKALECCSKGINRQVCEECVFRNKGNVFNIECLNLEKYALDLINRLQADRDNYKQIAENQQKIILDKAFEIKRLKAEIERLEEEIELLHSDHTYKFVKAKAKAEAYKECIEKVKEEIAKALESNYKARAEKENKEINLYLDNLFWNYCTGKIDCLRGIDDFCNNLLKELVGEDNG